MKTPKPKLAARVVCLAIAVLMVLGMFATVIFSLAA